MVLRTSLPKGWRQARQVENLVNLANMCASTGVGLLSVVVLLPGAVGCSTGKVVTRDLEKFQKAGPVKFEVVVTALVQAKTAVGPYRVVPGDLFSIRPAVLDPLSSSLAEGSRGAVLRRVGDDGIIWLPLRDKTDVPGLSLGKMGDRIAGIGTGATANMQATYDKDFSNSGGTRTRQNT